VELQEVEVLIDKNGQVRIEVHGVPGLSCLDLTRSLESALGGQVLERQMTPEAYQSEQATVEQRQKIQSG
jgi:hypothetical protein